jgi:hypothetical protein
VKVCKEQNTTAQWHVQSLCVQNFVSIFPVVENVSEGTPSHLKAYVTDIIQNGNKYVIMFVQVAIKITT